MKRGNNNLSNNKKDKGKEKKESLLEAFTSHKGSYIAAIQEKNDIHVCIPSWFSGHKFHLHVSIFFCFGLTVHRKCEHPELSVCTMIT